MPECRELAKDFLSEDGNHISTAVDLVRDKRHEVKLVGLLMMVELNKKSSQIEVYIDNSDFIVNWDLVDLTYRIPGDALLALPNLAQLSFEELPEWYQQHYNSINLWKVRISIVCLLLVQKEPKNIPLVSQLLVRKIKEMANDNYVLEIDGKVFPDHDLIFKAIGWVLRELGKIRMTALTIILDENIKEMSKVTVSYCTERMPPAQQKKYRQRKKTQSA